jgi:hypothetical protein
VKTKNAKPSPPSPGFPPTIINQAVVLRPKYVVENRCG